MGSLLSALSYLLFGWSAYEQARYEGKGHWKQFALTLLAAAIVFGLSMVPVFYLNSSFVSHHPGLLFSYVFGMIILGVALIARGSYRYNQRVRLNKSSTDSAKVVLLGMVLLLPFGFAAGQANSKLKLSGRSKTVEIQDPAWGIVAARFDIPVEWSFEGVLIRDQGCGFTPTIAWRASSPDGLSGVQSMPEFGSHWSDDTSFLRSYRQFHCKLMKPMEPEAFMKYILPIVRPDPTLGPVQPTMDAQQWQTNIASFNQRAGGGLAPAHETGGAIRSRIQYLYHGQAVEENFALRQITTQQKIGFYGGPSHSSWSTSAFVMTVRAPKGQLDDLMGAIGAMIGKGGFTQEWLQRSAQQMQRDQAQAMAAIRKQGDDTRAMLDRTHQEFMQAQDQRFQKSTAQWREHMDMMDRSAKAYELYSSDEQLMRNPQTGAVSQVTNQAGNNGWQEQNSKDILLTGDPNLNPNLYLRGNWTQLENVNPLKP
jgi:hypothetical protein